MAMSTESGGGYTSEINITPLVDVVLVLLIIFMVVSPAAQRWYDLAFPAPAAAPDPQEEVAEPVILAINGTACPAARRFDSGALSPSCIIRIHGDDLPVTELGTAMAAIYDARKPADRVLFVAAEEALNYEAVMRIVDTARAGVEGLTIGLVNDESVALGGA